MKIINAKVYTENFRFEERALCFEGALITDSGRTAKGETAADRTAAEDRTTSEDVSRAAGEEQIWDASGLLILPGLIDLHFHGCAGYDFCDGTMEALEAIAQYEASHGITGIAPASMPAPPEDLRKAFRCAAEYEKKHGSSRTIENSVDAACRDTDNPGAVLCGIHMEGPFFNPEKKGGCDGDYITDPDLTLCREYVEASAQLIQIVDVAPELPGAEEFIRTVSREHVVSVAHTAADYRAALRGFKAGASHVTHLFNAMQPFAHRDTGVVGAALDSGAAVELIGDGLHISDPMIRAAYRMFGDDRIVLISDSILAAGLADGNYMMGKLPIEVKDGLAYLEDGTIAGAASNLFDNLRHVIQCGVSPESVVRSATYNPAKVLGVLDQMGTLKAGKLANFIVVNEAFELQAVYVRGHRCR